MSEDWAPEDWARVGRVLKLRRRQRRWNQEELAARSGVSLAIVKEIETNSKTRRRGRRTLESLSEALGWPRQYLDEVLNGRLPEPESGASLQSRVETLEQRMNEIDMRLDTVIDIVHRIDSKVDVVLEIQHSHPDQQADP
jgi:transcriptional regulator with XRE-family HTH domain